jgi:hypothetical protein
MKEQNTNLPPAAGKLSLNLMGAEADGIKINRGRTEKKKKKKTPNSVRS